MTKEIREAGAKIVEAKEGLRDTVRVFVRDVHSPVVLAVLKESGLIDPVIHKIAMYTHTVYRDMFENEEYTDVKLYDDGWNLMGTIDIWDVYDDIMVNEKLKEQLDSALEKVNQSHISNKYARVMDIKLTL